MKISARYISLILLTCLMSVTKAQEAAYYEPASGLDKWSVGAFAGFSQFYGDVSQRNFFEKWGNDETKFSAGIMFGRQVNPWLTVRAQYFTAKLNSNKQTFNDGRPATLFMDAQFDEFGVHGKFHLNPFIWQQEQENQRRYQLYGLAGLGFATYNTELFDFELDDRINQNTASTATFDIGAGMDYRVYKNWNAMVETGWRFTSSDKVDVMEGGFGSDIPFTIHLGVNYKFGFSSDEESKKKPRRKQRKEEPEEEEQLARTEKGNYERLPGEGPDVLDFPMSDCHVDQSGTQKAQAEDSEKSISSRQQDSKSMSARSTRQSNQSSAYQQQDYNQSSASSEFEQGIIFSVQILATSKPADEDKLQQKHGIRYKVRERRSGGLYRYVVGIFRHYDDAVTYSEQLQQKGIYDAFVVVFRDGQKIRMTNALKNR